MIGARGVFSVNGRGVAQRAMPRIMPGGSYGGMATNAMNGRAISSMLGGGAAGTSRAITGATAKGAMAKVAGKTRGFSAAKMIAGGIVAAGVMGTIKNRSGRPADRVMGRPTGPYGY